MLAAIAESPKSSLLPDTSRHTSGHIAVSKVIADRKDGRVERFIKTSKSIVPFPFLFPYFCACAHLEIEGRLTMGIADVGEQEQLRRSVSFNVFPELDSKVHDVRDEYNEARSVFEANFPSRRARLVLNTFEEGQSEENGGFQSDQNSL
jgi:hypothetical protein